MRVFHGLTVAIAIAALAPVLGAQQDQEKSIAVKGGGITVAGWVGKVDANEEKAGMTIKDAKFAAEGKGFHVTTGPASTYWNPGNKATGDYTVKATFREPEYMNLNDHPHPYGIVIGGNDLGTATQSYIYCSAYGNGTFIVRGFGPDAFQVSARRAEANAAINKAAGPKQPVTQEIAFQVSARRAEANAAINKAAGPKQPVTQEIAFSVKGDKIECAVNGTVVGSYDKAAVVTAGKLKSTDGVYGLRFGHNTEVVVTGLTVTK